MFMINFVAGFAYAVLLLLLCFFYAAMPASHCILCADSNCWSEECSRDFDNRMTAVSVHVQLFWIRSMFPLCLIQLCFLLFHWKRSYVAFDSRILTDKEQFSPNWQHIPAQQVTKRRSFHQLTFLCFKNKVWFSLVCHLNRWDLLVEFLWEILVGWLFYDRLTVW